MSFLPADTEPNVLMDWVVANDVARPNVVATRHVSILIVQRDVITVERRWRRLNRSGRRRICRARAEANPANKTDQD